MTGRLSVLTVNVGNTNTKVCLFQDRRLVQRRIVPTREMRRQPDRFVPARKHLHGAALASVVSAATNRCAAAITRRTGLVPFLLDQDSILGLEVRYDRQQLGADRICDAVGARAIRHGDLIVVDFGTAVTVNIVKREGVFLGGPIMPGQNLMLESLHRTPARLPLVKPKRTARLFARRTSEALQAGTCQLLCLGIEQVVRRIEKATGRTFTVIATGGDAGRMKPQVPRIEVVEPDLAARGLLELFLLNRTRDSTNG